MVSNREVASQLERISQLLEVLGADRFKAIAHSRAARVVEGLSFEVATVAAEEGGAKKLCEIEGIGPKIADKVREFVTTGKIGELEKLSEQCPAGLFPLLGVPGMGPKTLRTLWQEGGVCSMDDLKRIIADGSILNLPRMGAKSVEKLKESIALAQTAGERVPLGIAWRVATAIAADLEKIAGVSRVSVAGSLRRGRDTIGDVDLLVASGESKRVMDAFTGRTDVSSVLASGEKKSSARVRIPAKAGRWRATGDDDGATIQVDVRVVPPESWGAALMYFTGSKEHNVRLRERAQRMGMTLNEYGLFREDNEKTPPQSRGVTPLAGASEEEVYAKLGVPWVPPELREDRGELALTETPRLVEVADIRSELHAHTTASDGLMSIDELAKLAMSKGYHTVAVTDHSKSSTLAGGLSVDALLEHVERVREADGRMKGITILAGSEVDVLADGSLDYPDDVLAKLDIVVASPHSALTQDPAAATKRLLRAVRHPMVHILGHPTGRLIGRRAGTSPDMAQVIAAAKESNTALEINAHWMRLDLRDVHVRAAADAGCLIAVNCDTHAPTDIENIAFGVMTARRGWLTRELCINTWDAKRLSAWLVEKRRTPRLKT